MAGRAKGRDGRQVQEHIVSLGIGEQNQGSLHVNYKELSATRLGWEACVLFRLTSYLGDFNSEKLKNVEETVAGFRSPETLSHAMASLTQRHSESER